MNCQRAQTLLVESLERPGTVDLDPELSAHLAICAECQREFATLSQTALALDQLSPGSPSPSLRRNFEAMLAAEKRSVTASPESVRPQARRVSMWRQLLFPLGAAALLAVGFLLGRQAPRSQPTAAEDGTRRELVALREKIEQHQQQLNAMSRLVGFSILQQQQGPANERLRDVLLAASQQAPTERTLDDLIAALTLDPSANVRLRAIEALYPHAKSDLVRAGIVAALPRERDPLVQLELIDFVAAAQMSAASPALKNLAADQGADATVRGAAQAALAYL